jgi:hypothetical protein
MHINKTIFFAALMALPSAGLQAQTLPTGAITGRVVDQGGLALPGVAVSASSPALQGVRSATSSSNGSFILPFLPAGEYKVTFNLSGFQRVERAGVRVQLAETVPVNTELAVAGVTESVTVSAETADDFTSSATVASSYKAATIDQLPVPRNLNGYTLLTPTANTNGPALTTGVGSGLTLVGSMSFESLFMVNGVVVNENIKGQPRDLYIEDAVDEVKISSGAISAEYGRFGGGVVNAATKSGGNDWHGSLRTTLENDAWRDLTPYEASLSSDPRIHKTIPTYEATLGGPFVHDKLWFFGAGRLRNREVSQTLKYSNLPYEIGEDQKRYEGKLTYALSRDHTLKASYTRIDQDNTNGSFDVVMDRPSLYDSRSEDRLLSANYTGVLSPNFFVEAQYSRRTFDTIGAGGQFTDVIRGTLMLDLSRNMARFNAPTLCGVCGTNGSPNEDKRNNQDVTLKGSYFLSTRSTGSHDLVLGFDMFDDMRENNNHISASDYRVYVDSTIIRGAQIFPVVSTPRPGAPLSTAFVQYDPVEILTQGNNARTYSGFVRDAWQLSRRWSFNLGLRYDKNHAMDEGGKLASTSGSFSPRLAASFDPKGERRLDAQRRLRALRGLPQQPHGRRGDGRRALQRLPVQLSGPGHQRGPARRQPQPRPRGPGAADHDGLVLRQWRPRPAAARHAQRPRSEPADPRRAPLAERLGVHSRG